MDHKEIDGVLAATLDDHRLSRGERHALKELIDDANPSPQRLAFYRHRAFALAHEAMSGRDNQQVLQWLENVVKVLHPVDDKSAEEQSRAEVLFSPGEACLDAIREQLTGVRRAVDICVFTITDDRLSNAIVDAHRRGVAVRVLSDDDKAGDLGSDVDRLAAAGVPVRVDDSPHHMHHKFAVFDAKRVVTGSYNWTRSAAKHNRENILITDDPRLTGPYQQMFERLWDEMGP